MPIYEYICVKCNYKVEKLHKIDESYFEKCQKCDLELKKKVSASYFKLKGNGWYETDFKKKK
ncbi:MAG TPA: FmdB family zinc ribbon protein [Candidatus Azoamicus sp. MARI]